MMKKEQSSSKPGPAHIIACDILCIVRFNVKVDMTEMELCIPFPEAYSVLRLYR